MKLKLGFITLTALLMALLSMNGCSNAKTTEEDKTDENLRELKQELRDVGQSIERLAENENEEFKAEVQKVLDNFNQKVDQFEQNLKDSGDMIDQETQRAIGNMENKAEGLQVKLNEFGDNTKENGEEFMEEVRHDFSEFGESINSFFSDDV